MRSNLYVWLSVLSLAFLLLLAVVLIRPAPLPGDADIIDRVQKAGVVSDPGSSAAQLVLLYAPPLALLAFLVFRRRWIVALWFATAVVSSILVSGTLQLVGGRTGPPPRAILEPQASGSFPSVSVEEVVVQAVLICNLAWQSSWAWRRIILALAIADVVLTSVLLIDIAAHWPTDVLGGLCFGGAWAMIALIAAQSWTRLRESIGGGS